MKHQFDQKEKLSLFGDVALEHWCHQKNGLEVVLSPRDRCGTVAVQVWYQVGSAHENHQATGLAHFFEHMMFRGTKKHGFGEYDRILEELGVNGGTNAFTWKDFTAYVQEVPRGALEQVLQLEADRMVDLDLSDQNIHEERGAVLDEKRRSLSDYDSIRFDTFFEHAFDNQSGAWPVLGYEEHIKQYDKVLLNDFYSKFYKPNNALIVICGDVNGDDALGMIEKSFGNIDRSENIFPQERRLLPGFHQMNQPISLDRLEMNFSVCEAGTVPWKWELIGKLLSGNETCLFEKELVASELVLNHSYWLSQSAAGSHFLHLSFTLMDQVSIDKVKDKIITLLSQPDWLTPQMLRAARVEADCDFYCQFESLDDRASLFGEMWIYARGFTSFSSRSQVLDRITLDQLKNDLKNMASSEIFELRALSQ